MAGKPRIPLERDKVLRAISLSGGVLQYVGDMLDIGRNTARDVINRDPEFKSAFEEAKEAFLDKCHSKLDHLMYNADEETVQMKTAMFFLEKLGQKRGFGVRQEIDLNHNALPSLVIDFADPRELHSGKPPEKIAEPVRDELPAPDMPSPVPISAGVSVVDGVASGIVINKDVTKGYE